MQGLLNRTHLLSGNIIKFWGHILRPQTIKPGRFPEGCPKAIAHHDLGCRSEDVPVVLITWGSQTHPRLWPGLAIRTTSTAAGEQRQTLRGEAHLTHQAALIYTPVPSLSYICHLYYELTKEIFFSVQVQIATTLFAAIQW